MSRLLLLRRTLTLTLTLTLTRSSSSCLLCPHKKNFGELRKGFCTQQEQEQEQDDKHAKKAPPIDFTQIPINRLPTVLILGRPNVGKSALFNRLIRRREALVYNTPDDHVTRDIREGVAKLGHLRFRVLDSAGLEALPSSSSSSSILHRTASITANVLASSLSALFLTDARAGLHPLDLQVGKWLRKHAPHIKPIVAMNKSESLFDATGSLASAANEMYRLGFGDPIAISAETGLGMHDLYLAIRPLLEDYFLRLSDGMSTPFYYNH